MKVQVIVSENYRRRIVRESRYPEDETMLILWDVYVCHRDRDFIEWIQGRFLRIIILYVPENLTNIYQPLDIYFNGKFTKSCST